MENIGYAIEDSKSYVGHIRNISKIGKGGWLSQVPQSKIVIQLVLIDPAVIEKYFLKSFKTERIKLTGYHKEKGIVFVEEFLADYQSQNNYLMKVDNIEVVTQVTITLTGKGPAKEMGLIFLGLRGRIDYSEARSKEVVMRLRKEMAFDEEEAKEDSHSEGPGIIIDLQHEETISFEKVEKSMKNISEDFICPITHQIMINPVVASDGHTYEKTEIANWIKRNRSSPLTGLRLKNKTLLPNLTIKKAIVRFMESMKSLGIKTQDNLEKNESPKQVPKQEWNKAFDEPDSSLEDSGSMI